MLVKVEKDKRGVYIVSISYNDYQWASVRVENKLQFDKVVDEMLKFLKEEMKIYYESLDNDQLLLWEKNVITLLTKPEYTERLLRRDASTANLLRDIKLRQKLHIVREIIHERGIGLEGEDDATRIRHRD